jgi:putative transposon-encoded protein
MRRMKTREIESTVTKSGNSGHVIVPKGWIGQDLIVKIKEVRK